MAVKTYRLGTGTIEAGLFAEIHETDQTAATRTTDGWTVAKVAAAKASNFFTSFKQLSSAFDTASFYPQNFLGGQKMGARVTGTLTGTFAATDWTFTFAVRATTASSQRGRMRLRIYKSSDPSGDPPTELTTSTLIGTTSAALSTSADVTTVVTWTPSAPVTLSNEYLFFIFAWEITTAGGSNSADVQLRTGQSAGGTRIVTSDLGSGVTPARRLRQSNQVAVMRPVLR